jgi:hypothetical protein
MDVVIVGAANVGAPYVGGIDVIVPNVGGIDVIVPNVIVPYEIVPNIIVPKGSTTDVIVPNVIVPNIIVPNSIVPNIIVPNEIVPNAIVPNVVADEKTSCSACSRTAYIRECITIKNNSFSKTFHKGCTKCTFAKCTTFLNYKNGKFDNEGKLWCQTHIPKNLVKKSL